VSESSGRVVIVTGGASGMGQASAQRLARKGYRVAILDLNEAGAKETAEKLVAEGHDAIGVAVDVSDRESIFASVDQVRQAYGPIEILVNSAGVAEFGDFLEITPDQWERMIRINLSGTWHMAQAVVPDMMAAKWGRLCLISSSSAQHGAPRMSHYVASKGGVVGLTKALATELSPHGITTNHIPPGMIITPMYHEGAKTGMFGEGVDTPPDIAKVAKRALPVQRPGHPDDIAAAVEYLVSDDASYITGQTINVNGGMYYS
jgi:2-hydroxycyclohexanecarboxyl-CoA dehydrogenase